MHKQVVLLLKLRQILRLTGVCVSTKLKETDLSSFPLFKFFLVTSNVIKLQFYYMKSSSYEEARKTEM